MIGFNHLGKLGQLGNQMFQYAATKGVAAKLNTSFTVPNHDEVLVDALGNCLRIELDNVFDLKCQRGFLQTNNYYEEKSFEYDEKIFELDGNTSLFGFFQTGKYFKHIEDDIRIDFTFKKEIQDTCDEIIEQFDNPIALHIRRGDFLINSGNHANLELDYYKKALKEFDEKRQVIIFSDDPIWCKEEDIFSDDRFLVSDGNSPYQDLYMMTKCSDFIIANSTFSWWGAWLANVGKVIAPSIWFGPNLKYKNLKDLYCDNWVVL